MSKNNRLKYEYLTTPKFGVHTREVVMRRKSPVYNSQVQAQRKKKLLVIFNSGESGSPRKEVSIFKRNLIFQIGLP